MDDITKGVAKKYTKIIFLLSEVKLNGLKAYEFKQVQSIDDSKKIETLLTWITSQF